MEMYERIRELRKEYLHLSQEKFGERLGVTRDVIKNIELNALKKPDQKEPLIRLICKEFDIREEWLRDGIEPMKHELSRDEAIIDWAASLVSGENEDNLTEEMVFAKKFAGVLSQLSADDWKVLAKMAKMLLSEKR